MANRIVNKISNAVLTCFFPRAIVVSTDGNYIDVSVSNARTGRQLLSTRYYAFDEEVYIRDVGQLIETDLRRTGRSLDEFRVNVGNGDGDDEMAFKAIYCDRFSVCTEPNVFLRENFLTTLDVRRVAPNFNLWFSYFNVEAEVGIAQISYRYRLMTSSRPDEVLAHSYTKNVGSATQDIVLVAISEGELRRQFDYEEEDLEILEATVSVGDRSVTCYVDKSLKAEDGIIFSNCFNVQETAFIRGTTTVKTSVEQSQAVVDGRIEQYDRQFNSVFEVQTEPLTSDEAIWIEQLLNSHSIAKMFANSCSEAENPIDEKILITDYSCEISDTNEKPNTVKFTWRLADQRPLVQMNGSLHIFTSPYNIVFS